MKMKAFKEWWNNYIDGRDKPMCEIIWRAALEWTKQKMLDNADGETLTFSDIEDELSSSQQSN